MFFLSKRKKLDRHIDVEFCQEYISGIHKCNGVRTKALDPNWQLLAGKMAGFEGFLYHEKKQLLPDKLVLASESTTSALTQRARPSVIHFTVMTKQSTYQHSKSLTIFNTPGTLPLV